METKRLSGTDLKIKLDDVTIGYNDLGVGTIPIIFIHGFPFDKSSWNPQLEFMKLTHRVISYDIRGFGKSTPGKEKFSIDLFADDLIKLMDILHIPEAIVCGLSMGGYILLNATTRYPKRFKAIILSNTQCIADSQEAKEKRYKAIENIKTGGFKDFVKGFIENAFYPESIGNDSELITRIKTVVLSTSPDIVIETLKALAERTETCSMLNKITIPALIICGKEDKLVPNAQSEYLNQNISDSNLHIIGKAGHLTNLDQPDEFNRHILHFISGL